MDAVREVKSRLNIEDVIGEYVRLKRTGRNYKGLSPWTNEKTPSFIVSPEKQIWHDFSSGKGGDIFSFVMEVEGLEFRETLTMLARKAGVDLDKFDNRSDSGAAKRKARAVDALELAAKFYQKQLIASKGALDYLRTKRGFSKQTVLDWRFGYSPNTDRALADFLIKKGFTENEMRAAGLITVRRGQIIDMFRGRIMIPLADSRGQIVGFTARLLEDFALGTPSNAPKYINTPSTAVYDKSRQVFGLHLAKEAIRKTGYVVVAEGNLDVIASHQAGVANVVASAGTAMTEQHLKALKRFTGDVRLSFDADSAGIAATERVIPLAQKAEVNLRIINLGGAKDPDEIISKDPKKWQRTVEEAKPALDWLVDRYKSQLDLKTASGKKAFTDALLINIGRLLDPVEQEHYLRLVAELTDTSYDSIKAKLGQGNKEVPTPLRQVKELTTSEATQINLDYQKLQDHFLSMVLCKPKLRDLLNDLKPTYFSDGPARYIYAFLKSHPDFTGQPKQIASLRDAGDYVKIISLLFEELYQALPADELKEQAANLKQRVIASYVKIRKHQIAGEIKQTTNESKINKLVTEANKLNELIKDNR